MILKTIRNIFISLGVYLILMVVSIRVITTHFLNPQIGIIVCLLLDILWGMIGLTLFFKLEY